MSIDLKPLANIRRLLFEVALQPMQGKRFQPTGFPDLGAATYQAGGTACLLVESAQSMANRMELTIWDNGANELKSFASGLSYIRVNDKNDKFLTCSVTEAHRANSVYIEKSEGNFFTKVFQEALGVDKKRPVNRQKLCQGLFQYDINSLLHGVFLESLDGRLRVARAISSFIEAEQTMPANSGGAKIDHVQASKDEDSTAKDGFGNVTFHREEFTAERIIAFFNVDLQQIRSYGLETEPTHLLIVLALFKIRSLLDGDLRLRTACDLEPVNDIINARMPKNFELPSLNDLASELEKLNKKCESQMKTTTVTFKK
jgi:CRISPR-associated protein Csb1